MDHTATPATKPPTVTITREQIERWAGRGLSDDEIARLDDCIPHSSIPAAIGEIVAQFAPDPDTEATDHEDQDNTGDPTTCQLCGAPGGFPYCTASCAEVIELDSLSPTSR